MAVPAAADRPRRRPGRTELPRTGSDIDRLVAAGLAATAGGAALVLWSADRKARPGPTVDVPGAADPRRHLSAGAPPGGPDRLTPPSLPRLTSGGRPRDLSAARVAGRAGGALGDQVLSSGTQLLLIVLVARQADPTTSAP